MTEGYTPRPARSQSPGWLVGLAALVVVLLLFAGGGWVGWQVYRARQMIELLELQRAMLQAKEAEANARAAADKASAQVEGQQDAAGGAQEPSPRADELP
jgi:hypothetical protein